MGELVCHRAASTSRNKEENSGDTISSTALVMAGDATCTLEMKGAEITKRNMRRKRETM